MPGNAGSDAPGQPLSEADSVTHLLLTTAAAEAPLCITEEPWLRRWCLGLLFAHRGMKLKQLESLLQDIAPFASARVELEQYPSSPHLAAQILFAAESRGDVSGRAVVDLGCGAGMLSIAAGVMGAAAVTGIDVDADALADALANVDGFEDLSIDFVLQDVIASAAAAGPGEQGPRLWADTVIMNPPFGTKRKGADMAFLAAAAALVTRPGRGGVVYTLHKSSTRDHVRKVAERELGASSAELLAEMRWALPATMKFHREKSVDVAVDLWRFEFRPPP